MKYMELTYGNIRYLLTVWELSKNRVSVSSTEIAEKLQVKKASVTRMTVSLSEKDLLEKPRYGKITLSETGKNMAESLSGIICDMAAYFQNDYGITGEEAWEAACAAVCRFPNRIFSAQEERI